MAQIDPKKRARLVTLAKTGLYARGDIKEKLLEEFGTSINDETLTNILTEEKITLPEMQDTERFKKRKLVESAAKSKYLKGYTYEDLEIDIKSGKSRVEIVDDILKKNPSNIKNIRQLTLSALGSRIQKRPELAKLDFINQKNLTKNKKTALKDLKDFVNKNKEAYKKVYASKKVGAVSGFKEKVLDYISQNYPNLINRSKGGRDILTGQRIFTGFDLLGRDVTGKGEYGRDLQLNKIIRKSLGIPERPLKGEGASIDRLNRVYNKNITNLLKEAQKQGKVPLVDPQTGFKINSEAAYSRYIDRKNIDPVRNLFGKYFKFGTEHMGGVARANLINDVDALNQVVALDTFTNKFDKGATVDRKITTLLNLAKQSSGNKAKEYLKTANELLKESDAKYGLDSTKYKLVKNEIVPIQPNEENIFKRAIRSFVATERYKDPNFKLLDPDLKKSIMAFKKGDEETGSKFLKTAVQTLIKSTDKLTKSEQLRFCKFLSNGGLPGDCKNAIKQDPEKAAKILSEAPVTSAAMNNVKKDSQKLIRLFRGESFPQRNIKGFKDKAKFFKTTIPEIKKDTLSGQWFTPTQDHAGSYLSRPGRMKYVDVTPQELESFQKYKDRVNRRPVKYSVKKMQGLPDPPLHGVTESFHHQLIPRYKLKQMEKAGRLKSKYDLNPFGKRFINDAPLIPATKGVLEWNRELGAFVDSANPGEVVGQNQLKAWADDNPMPVKAGTEDAFKPVKKNMLKTIGKSLAYVGAPLATAIIDSYFIGKQIAEDRPAENIVKDPLNWLGLATMSTLSDISGVSQPGKINTALRLGMSPGLIRGISRFAGLPGLAISTALTAYDQYQKYKNEEGLIYNLFNKRAEPL